ncbi:MAG TPA: hypothetical protein VJ596_06470 [Gemmatimonadaceae bacterium]|nr:hypothetical protein [Gemmatimonadaceae bacterium]
MVAHLIEYIQPERPIGTSVHDENTLSPPPAFGSPSVRLQWTKLLLAGALSGLLAGLLFATAHALIIVPIWTRMTRGLVSAALAGTAIAWGYGEMVVRQRPSIGATSAAASLRAGARFGALLWLAVAPVTLVCAMFPGRGFVRRYEMLEVIVAVVLALAGGAVLGHHLAGTWRARIAGAASALLLTVTMAGPVPIENSARALGIFLAVLPACVVAGALLGWIARGTVREFAR